MPKPNLPHRELLEKLLQGSGDPLDFARQQGLPLEKVVEWALDIKSQIDCCGLETISNWQAQLLAARCRVHAVTCLLRLSDISPEEREHQGRPVISAARMEVARKACMDLLELGLAGTEKPGPDDFARARSQAKTEEFTERMMAMREKAAGIAPA